MPFDEAQLEITVNIFTKCIKYQEGFNLHYDITKQGDEEAQGFINNNPRKNSPILKNSNKQNGGNNKNGNRAAPQQNRSTGNGRRNNQQGGRKRNNVQQKQQRKSNNGNSRKQNGNSGGCPGGSLDKCIGKDITRLICSIYRAKLHSNFSEMACVPVPGIKAYGICVSECGKRCPE